MMIPSLMAQRSLMDGTLRRLEEYLIVAAGELTIII
jgi:hypothetical protein